MVINGVGPTEGRPLNYFTVNVNDINIMLKSIHFFNLIHLLKYVKINIGEMILINN